MSSSRFDDAVSHYEAYLARTEPEAVGMARVRLAEWLAHGAPDQRVRVVLTPDPFSVSRRRSDLPGGE
jgi:hypothetical protein